MTIQPLSESETVAKCRIQPANYDLKIVRQPNESEKLELLKCDWTVKVIVLCGRQNIALRGHTEEKSNFMALVNFRAETYLVLA